MIFGFGRKNTAEAKIVVTAKTAQAKKGLKDVDKSVANMNKSFRDAKSSMGVTAAAIAGITVAALAAKKALDFTIESNVKFEAAGAKLRAILKPTTEEFKALEEAALQLGATTVFTAAQVTEAFIEMGKLGLETNEILASGNEVLALAALAQVEMSEAARVTVQTLNQFQLEATDAGRVVDVIAKSFTSSALDINKFSEAMKFIGPIAGQTGESLEDISGAISVLADNALESSLAGTAMRRMLLELANANSKASKKIAATGKSAETFVDKLKILRDMQLSVTEATELFGLRAVTGAKIVIENAEAVEELSTQYENANGAAKEMAETMLDSVEGASIRLKSAQEALALSIKEVMIPVLRAWNEWLISINLGIKAIITGEAKKIKEQTAATKEMLETQIAKQAEIFALEDKINAARESGAKTVQIFEGRRATRLENAVRLLRQLKKEQGELLKVEEKAGKKEKETVVTKKGGLTDAQKKALEKSKKELLKIEKGFEEEILKLKKAANDAGNAERRKELEKEKQDLIDAEKKKQEEILFIKDEHFNMLMENEENYHDNRLSVLEEQKAFYPQLESEINALIEEENKRHREHEKAEDDKLVQDRIKNAQEAFGALSTINGAIMSMIDSRTDREIKNLEKQNLSEEEFEKKREEILEEGEQKRRAFARVQQGIAIAEATIDAIQMGIGAGADTPGGAITRILAMGAGIAAGLAEVVTIQAQNFQTGRIGEVSRGRQADTIPALLGRGETVISAPQSAANEDTLRAIQNNTANTAAGLSGSRGGNTIQIYGASPEEILNVINAKERRNSTGLRI